MLYELSETEIKHIEKYRKLLPVEQGKIDEVIDRIIELDEEIDRLAKERTT